MRKIHHRKDNIELSDGEGNDIQGTDGLNSDSGALDVVLSDSEGEDAEQVSADTGTALDSEDGSVSEDATTEDVSASSDTLPTDDTFEPPHSIRTKPIALQVVSPSSVDVELDEPAVF